MIYFFFRDADIFIPGDEAVKSLLRRIEVLIKNVDSVTAINLAGILVKMGINDKNPSFKRLMQVNLSFNTRITCSH